MARKDEPVKEFNDRLSSYWFLRRWVQPTIGELTKTLEGHNVVVAKGSKKKTLEPQVTRFLRGFQVQYDKCSTQELRGFVEARGLGVRSPRRNVFIARLEEADKEHTFKKFFKLPPELRNRVYQFHFGAMPRKLQICMQPPITRTSKLMRDETLDLFFSWRAFEFKFSRRLNPKPVRLRATNETAQFLALMHENVIKSLREITLTFEADHGLSEVARCDIEIKPSASEFTVKIKNDHDAEYGVDYLERRQALCDLAEEEIRTIVARACSCGEADDPKDPEFLRAMDFYAIRGVIERYFV